MICICKKKTLKNILREIIIIYWVMDGTNIGPYFPPPIPGVAKVPSQAGNKFPPKCFSYDIQDLY